MASDIFTKADSYCFYFGADSAFGSFIYRTFKSEKAEFNKS